MRCLWGTQRDTFSGKLNKQLRQSGQGRTQSLSDINIQGAETLREVPRRPYGMRKGRSQVTPTFKGQAEKEEGRRATGIKG